MSMVLDNAPWQDLGFKRRPRYGAILERLRPTWRVALENKVLQEMLAIFSAAYIVAETDKDNLTERLVGIYMATPELSAAFGFASQRDGASYMNNAIGEYVVVSPRKWHEILLSHLSALQVPDKSLSARLTVGCIKFCINIEGMILILRSTP
jgi:N-dimethylarginine dimethylaminohydrolase